MRRSTARRLVAPLEAALLAGPWKLLRSRGRQQLFDLEADPAERDAHQHDLAARSDTLIEELLAHDLIVLAVPLYNLGIPSQLKAWFDRVLRAGKTFRYTENGPVGLVEGKRALILAARGGQYAGTALDTQTGHVNSLLGLMGIQDTDWIYAEGLNMGEALRDRAMGEARQAVTHYVTERLCPRTAGANRVISMRRGGSS